MAAEPTDKKTGAVERVLTFRVKDQLFALHIITVKEVIDYKQVTKVPLVPDFIKGIYNLRGDVLPVIDLGRRLGWEPTEKTRMTCIIIAEILFEGRLLDMGLMVDGVQAVLSMSEDDMVDAPNFGTRIRSDFISKVAKKAGDFILILNLEKILDIEEIRTLREITDSDASQEIKHG